MLAASLLLGDLLPVEWPPPAQTRLKTGHLLICNRLHLPPQSPSEMLAAALLLGDLFPVEWPPPGAACRPGQPHPPPSGMAARAAMARSLEGVTGPLAGLISAAAGCEARVFRAALVRLAARAAGAPFAVNDVTKKLAVSGLGLVLNELVVVITVVVRSAAQKSNLGVRWPHRMAHGRQLSARSLIT